MARRAKKGTKSWYKQKCDTIFSKIVRSIGYCEKCGTTESLQCAHIEPRTNHTLRWDKNNALSLCYSCHIHWAHKNPREFTHWVESEFPKKIKYIDKNKNIFTKRSLPDYEDLYEKLKHELKEIEQA